VNKNLKLIKKSIINSDNQLTVDLFHGTSTLFLDSIIKNGLGGMNPLSEWKILDLCKEVYELSREHLQETDLFRLSSYSFQNMAEQSNTGTFNFQHGDSYLSPSKYTAARYAINKEYGSELLTYTIDFLKELLNKDIPYVKKDLFRKYPKIFGLIKARPSPLLIQVKNVNVSFLLSEHGKDPKYNIERMEEEMNSNDDLFDAVMQQTNFRLKTSILANDLRFYLINVQKWNSFKSQYNLYEINTNEIKE